MITSMNRINQRAGAGKASARTGRHTGEMFSNPFFGGQHHHGLRAAIIFFSHGTSRQAWRVTGHTHHYWQMEVSVAGITSICSGNNTTTLKPNDVAFIPPNTAHEIIYPAQRRETWSIKFEIYDPSVTTYPSEILIHPGDPLVAGTLLKFLKRGRRISRTHLCALEHLIASLVAVTYAEEASPESRSLRTIRQVLQHEAGKPLTVDELAARVGMSTGHLRALLAKESGMTPKALIDAERLNKAREYLLYSELNCSEISDFMGFPDLFSFSRFFKRLSGESPRDYRRRMQAGPAGHGQR